MIDARTYWEQRHARRHHRYLNEPSNLAGLVAKLDLQAGARVLSLGCGVGTDEMFFADRGLEVVGLDYSMVALRLAQATCRERTIASINWVCADMSQGLGFATATFDVVHANLALHYFDDETLEYTLDDIYRVLRVPGWLSMSVRSIYDSKWGIGEQVSERSFNQHGCLRVFFDPDYLRQKLIRFRIDWLSSSQLDLTGDVLLALAAKA